MEYWGEEEEANNETLDNEQEFEKKIIWKKKKNIKGWGKNNTIIT